MNSWPVIVRELRAEARRPVNHWLRVLAGGAGVTVAGTLMAGSRLPPALLGGHLFAALHTTLCITFLVVVPLMTADCVSQERREGTLGLLFLTPLTALDIILGKSLVHLVRALTLFLAAIPVLALPFLLGGVGWLDARTAVAFEACAVLLGAGAGLLATSKGGTATQVFVWAEIYVFLLAAAFGAIFDIAFLSNLLPRLSVRPPAGQWAGILVAMPYALASGMIGRGGWGAGLVGAYTWMRGAWDRTLVETLLLCLTLFGLALARTVRRLKQTWQDAGADTAQPRWVKLFSGSAFWRAVFRWNKSRTLDRNPIAWLQEYSWTARLTKWGWCLLILGVELELLTHWNGSYFDYLRWQPFVSLALVLGITFSAVSSFRRERQRGLLELLLVTPLSARQLIGGRLWGVWCHFLPAIAVLLVGWSGDWLLGGIWRFIPAGGFGFNTFRGYGFQAYGFQLLGLVTTFAALPVIGLYLALSRLHVLLAWLATLAAGLLLPFLFFLSLSFVTSLAGVNRANWEPWDAVPFLQGLIAIQCFNRLNAALARRKFEFCGAA